MKPEARLPTRPLPLQEGERRPNSRTEWLVTNGLGGYASGTVAGGLTRRFHGLLIAALPAPYGRMLYVSHVRAEVSILTHRYVIDHEDVARLEQADVAPLIDFRLDGGLPVWRYGAGRAVLEKRLFMVHGSNTTIVRYSLEGDDAATLHLTPLIQVRPHEAESPVVRPETMIIGGGRPHWRLHVDKSVPGLEWSIHGDIQSDDFSTPLDAPLSYSVEQERGYAHAGVLWYPGSVDLLLGPGTSADVVLSVGESGVAARVSPDREFTHEMDRRRALVERLGNHADDPVAAELAIAADQFLIRPVAHEPAGDASTRGKRATTVIAGYHWFTDWGRDTMISLEGLTLCTGRSAEAASILRVFAAHVEHGLIPNFFPEGEQKGLYHTADATLWFVHAIGRYAEITNDRALLDELLPIVCDILDHHLAGTRFGIGVDPADGLLTQGAAHYQLTWMDAKVGDWVVTPRRGKAVEINALWYNALRLTQAWTRSAGEKDSAARYQSAADATYASFNRRFWNPATGYLFDVVDGEDGDDAACRPNQLIAISLAHPVLAPEYWHPVVAAAEERLLTPVGLRSLSADHPRYQRRYFGDLRARDAAYHQGTVWAWLIGPFIDAWLKLSPDDAASARQVLMRLLPHLNEACVGSISEIFDAEPPFAPRGCVAQAWSVAEVLRCLQRTSMLAAGIDSASVSAHS